MFMCARVLSCEGAEAMRSFPTGGSSKLPPFAPGSEVVGLTPGLPVANFPEIADRSIGERQRMQIAGRAELGSERGGFVAAFFLRVPDEPPPAFVGGEVNCVFRGARVGHLRALFITDAGVKMQTTCRALT